MSPNTVNKQQQLLAFAIKLLKYHLMCMEKEGCTSGFLYKNTKLVINRYVELNCK